jgi:hypothetical protein
MNSPPDVSCTQHQADRNPAHTSVETHRSSQAAATPPSDGKKALPKDNIASGQELTAENLAGLKGFNVQGSTASALTPNIAAVDSKLRSTEAWSPYQRTYSRKLHQENLATLCRAADKILDTIEYDPSCKPRP